MWVRADLRRRWRSWVVLGLLAGVSVGLACAGIAGARRAENAVPAYARASHLPDAAILANDAAFDASVRARIDALPEVTRSYPFMVAFLLETDREGLDGPLVPTAPQTAETNYGVIVDGRAPDPNRADEVVVNENVRDRFGLHIGSTYTLVQDPPADASEFPFALPSRVSEPIHQRVRVVGISKATGDDLDTSPSSAFYAKYQDQLVGFINEFVDLRGRPGDLARLQNDVERITGKPINVEDAGDLFGTRQLKSIADVERTGLLLFALAVLIGAGALVGQALVRAVSAGGADLTTWRALGADRRIARRALVIPATITAVVGAITGVAIAVLLSPRFPIALVRQLDLDVGFHADWLVLLVGAFGAIVAIVSTAWVTAELRVRRDSARTGRAPFAARWATLNSLPPALLIGSRLATEAGRGRRAVPVRSALIGAIVGVLGVVGCLTFRSGLSDVVHDPQRSGIVWDAGVAGVGVLPPETVATVSNDKAVAAAYDALWARAIKINGTPTPTFGTKPVKGDIHPVVLAGRAPRTATEIALAPTTMKRLGLHIGDRVRVGAAATPNVRVVGKALLPETSHTSYDQSALDDGRRARPGAARGRRRERRLHRGLLAPALEAAHRHPRGARSLPEARRPGRALRERRCDVADGRRRARRPARAAVLARDLLRAARDRDGRARACHHRASPACAISRSSVPSASPSATHASRSRGRRRCSQSPVSSSASRSGSSPGGSRGSSSRTRSRSCTRHRSRSSRYC